MSDPIHEFDDPRLKEAVRSAFGGESAPPALRQRIAAIMSAGATAAHGAGDRVDNEHGRSAAEQGTGNPDRPDSQRLRRPDRSWWSRQLTLRNGIAAAAALVAIGFMVVQIRSEFSSPPQAAPGTYASVTSFPETFAIEMVHAHENCAKLSDHHLVPGDSPAAVKAPLTKAEGMTVAAVDLGGGWQFQGAGLCQVGSAKAAHLLYARGAERLSLFSLPAPDSCATASGKYTQVVQGHPMAGVVVNGAVYCLVGSAGGELTPSSLEPLLARVRADVTPHTCAGGGSAMARSEMGDEFRALD